MLEFYDEIVSVCWSWSGRKSFVLVGDDDVMRVIHGVGLETRVLIDDTTKGHQKIISLPSGSRLKYHSMFMYDVMMMCCHC